MKRTWWIAVAIATAISIALMAFPSIREEMDWKWASYRDHSENYSGHIAAWPKGRHTEEARMRLDERVWETAAAQNTFEFYDLYLKTLPEGKHVNEALAQKEEITWVKTTSSDTALDYRDYLSKYPEGKFSPQAREKLDDKSWDEARSNGTVGAYRIYIHDFPEGMHRSEAKSGIEDLVTYRTLTPGDGLSCSFSQDIFLNPGFNSSGTAYAPANHFECTDKAGKKREIELISTKNAVPEGQKVAIKTKDFGTVYRGNEKGNYDTYELTDSQIKKLKTFLGF
jgi:hypothetical protein